MAKINDSAFILKGTIMHHRTAPKVNSFTYKGTYFSFPLGKISKIKSRFFSFNSRNIFSISDSDYVNKVKISEVLQEHQINDISEIVLVTQAKTLGYVFNPVSFFLCFQKEKLIAVLCEVNNRSNQTHSYLVRNDNLTEILPDQWFDAKKEFYVSPFLKVEGDYKFRFVVNENEAGFYINYLVENKLILATYLKCSYQKFNDKNLLLEFLRRSFSTFKTTTLIHYQALKLALKGLSFYRCPKQSKNQITLSSK